MGCAASTESKKVSTNDETPPVTPTSSDVAGPVAAHQHAHVQAPTSTNPSDKKRTPSKEDTFRRRRLSVGVKSKEDVLASSKPSLLQRGVPRLSRERGADCDFESLAFPINVVGSFSCHGAQPDQDGVMQGKINQDRGCCCFPFGPDKSIKQALFCVFDGHGVHTCRAAQHPILTRPSLLHHATARRACSRAI